MLWYLIPGAVALLALLVMVLVIRRVLPRLAIIDVATIARERESARKHQIALERAERLRSSLVAALRARLRPFSRAINEQLHLWYKRALELERRYRHLGKVPTTLAAKDRAAALVVEGLGLAEEGRLREAEHRFIEAINLHPMEAKAYEGLGRLYVREKQWSDAEESFRFLLKIDANDASAYANLGELYLAKGSPAEALAPLSRAVELKSTHPRLITLLLEAAIAARDKELAYRTFARLKEVAPQFPALADWEEKITRM